MPFARDDRTRSRAGSGHHERHHRDHPETAEEDGRSVPVVFVPGVSTADFHHGCDRHRSCLARRFHAALRREAVDPGGREDVMRPMGHA